MKRILLAAVVSAAFGTCAFAADLPTKAPVSKPLDTPYSWAGFYIGVEGGGGWADTRHTNAINGGTSGTIRINGGVFGGTYGYNWQQGPWVVGFEGDMSWSGIKDTFFDNGNPTLFCPATFNVPCMTNLRWFGTDRARLGYTWDNVFVFGTAGIAYGNVQGSLYNTIPTFTVGDNTRAGFVGGFGIEWAFAPAWSVKADFMRADLGSKITYQHTAGAVSPEIVSLKQVDIARVGLNYHFR